MAFFIAQKLKHPSYWMILLYNTLIGFVMSSPLVTAPSSTFSTLTLRQKIGQMIMVGFHGTTPQDPQIQTLSDHIRQGNVGGIIFFGYNIVNPHQTRRLTQHFRSLSAPHPLLLALDQEGGRIQRLRSDNGFKDFKSAKTIAQTCTPSQARIHYEDMAQITAATGFNLVLGPVVDLEYDPTGIQQDENRRQNPAIGGLERAYDADPETVIHYARSFIHAHRTHGILTSLKHFPGHGLAPADTHIELTDITRTFQPDFELAPYLALSKTNEVDMVMTAHVMLRTLDQHHPATLSPVILKKLLREQGYKGVIITDDLFMGAIQKNYTLKEMVLMALNADVDILLFSINQGAQKNVNGIPSTQGKLYHHGKILEDVISIIETAIQAGDLSTQRIETSYARIVALKDKCTHLSTPAYGKSDRYN